MTSNTVDQSPPMSPNGRNNDSPPPTDGPWPGFFYGTLMVPEIFFRVTHGTESPMPWVARQYTFAPAILRDFSRRRVTNCDFPAIIPQQGHYVLGSWVTGLTYSDVYNLNRFEGSMYSLEECGVQVLADNAILEDGTANEKVVEQAEREFQDGKAKMMGAKVYVWADSIEDLEEEEWSYADFRRNKMPLWVLGKDEEYAEATDVQRKVGDGGNSADEKVVQDEDEYVWGGRRRDNTEAKEEVSEPEESEELRTKRIVSVIAGIAYEEEAEELKNGEKEILASAV